jgi:hypothetical protein
LILPQYDDARSWEVVEKLLSLGYLPLRGSRTFKTLSPYPEGLGGNRSPKINLVVGLHHHKPKRFLQRTRYYRLAIRRHVGSVHTNERSLVACLLPAGFLGNDQLLLEGTPWNRPNSSALYIASLLSSFTAESYIRHLIGTMMSLSILSQGHL